MESFKYALVLVNVANLGMKTFSYIIPDEISCKIKIGQPVLVSFGRQGIINAFVVGFSNYLPEHIKAKSILELIDETPLFDLEYLKLLEWVANYYCCDIQTVLACAVPMKFLTQSKRIISLNIDNFNFNNLTTDEIKIVELLKEKFYNSIALQKKIKITSSKFHTILRKLKSKKIINIENILDENTQKIQTEKYIDFLSDENATKRQQEILNALKEMGEVRLIDFEKSIKTTRVSILKLEAANMVKIVEKDIYRNPLSIFKTGTNEIFPTLTDEQQKAYDEITERIKKVSATDYQGSKTIYLHGVTASGKTEIYFNLIKNTIGKGQNILFLAPEIALASQLTARIAKRFGIEDVAIWHSSISDGERYDVWQKLKKNQIKILAGARSAVFAPLKNIGLIIIDEEHEATYKQTNPNPRYDARKVAEKLSALNNSILILGSATPDIVNYYIAKNSNNLITLKNRFNNSKMAKVIMINLKEETKEFGSSIFSRSLITAIQENLSNSKQSVLLINRRGFSTFTICQACQTIVECPNCAIPLIWHAKEGKLKCHYCNYEQDYPKFCQKCGSSALKNAGTGIQKVEEISQKLFPTAKIARLDSDILTKKYEHIEILQKFAEGEIDILIGTQMIAKGLDNPNVTLVGVISADGSFAIPDYRSCERGFQLLTQVAGRAGRGDFDGKVYFQSANPQFYALQAAKEQDYEQFYETEIKSREEFDYPPYSQIIRFILSSENQFRAEKSALEIAMRLSEWIDKKSLSERLEVLGPAPCIIERIRGEYRFQILIKNKLTEKGHLLITSFISKIKLPADITMVVDVDPLDIL